MIIHNGLILKLEKEAEKKYNNEFGTRTTETSVENLVRR